MIAIQHTAADLIMKERSRGPLVFLMLKYVPMIPPARPITPPAIPPIQPHMAPVFILSISPQNIKITGLSGSFFGWVKLSI